MAPPVRIKEIAFAILLFWLSSCSAQTDGSGAGPCDLTCHTDATCTDVDGSDKCICKAGFTGNGIDCTAIVDPDNPCDDGTHDCNENASCEPIDDSFTCNCNDGYAGDGKNCEDIDECNAGTEKCNENAGCSNTIGSFTCACIAGYTGDGVNCADIDECAAGANDCGENAACTNSVGSFNCACNLGFTGDGVTCEAIQCKTEPTIDNGAATGCGVPAGIGETCNLQCNENFYLTAGEGIATCENDGGSDGSWNVGGSKCSAIRCPTSSIIENGAAIDCDGPKDVGEVCALTCNLGYVLSGDGTVNCVNDGDAEGSWNDVAEQCTDIDECLSEFDNNCSPEPKGSCKNTPGSYECSCTDGYAGDGTNCQEKEVLPAPRQASIKETKATMEIVTNRLHQSFEIQLLSADNVVLREFSQTITSIIFDDLDPDTEYNVQTRIAVLQNGVSVDLDFSAPQNFRTKAVAIPANIVSQQIFLQEYTIITSPESQAFISTLTQIIRTENGLQFISSFVVLQLIRGSVNAVGEFTTNGTTNETLADAEITNPNITATEVEKGVDPPPGNVAVTDITTSSFVISFDPVAMATQYQITVEYQNSTVDKFTNETSLLVDDLPSNTLIVTSVRAFIQEEDGGAARISNRSEDIVITTVAEGPSNLAITVLNGNCIIVQFDAVNTAETYHVTFKDDSSLDFTLSADIEANGVLNKQVEGLTSDTSYTIGVVAVVGAQSSTESTATATTGPETVPNVAIYNVSNDGFNIKFDSIDIVPEITTSYVVKYTWGSGNEETNSDETDVRISANPLTTNYMVSVAYQTTKKSAYSAEFSTRIWEISSVTSAGFNLSWDQYKTATVYNVSLSPGTSPGELTGRMTLLTGLSAGTEHTIKVSTGGKTLLTVTQSTCPPAIANLACTPTSVECMTVNFDSSLSATSYDLSVPEDASATITVNTEDSTAEICGLTSGTSYTVNAKAVNSACESEVESVTDCVTDVLECEDGSHNCDGNATCTNTLGSFTCACNNGFSGDGITCDDINECTGGTAGCDANADCSNTIGSYTCTCRAGYEGPGKTCEDIDECVIGTADRCVLNTDCTNTPGTYTCACKSGYQGEPAGEPTVCTEILGAPELVFVETTTLKVKIQPMGSYQQYEYVLSDDSGVLEQPRSGETTYTFAVTAGRQYTVTARITILANGTTVDVDQSDPLTVTTLAQKLVVNVVLTDQTFINNLLDRNSAAFASMSATVLDRLNNGFPGQSFTFTILTFYSGSVGVLGTIGSENPLFDITGATIAGGSITEATLSTTSPPDGLAVSDVTSSGFTASWTAVTSANRYVLSVSCNNDSQIYQVDAPQIEAVATGLNPNTACEVKVRATFDGTPLTATEESLGESLTTLSKVETVELTALGHQRVSVRFSAVSGAASYAITVNDTDSTTVDADSDEISDGHITKEFDLATEGTYEVRVVPVVDGVDGEPQTATITLVSTVLGLKVFNITEDGFDVVYDAVVLQGGTAVSYVITYNDGTEHTSETSAAQLHIPSQPLERNYQVMVAYKTDAETSTNSDPLPTNVYTVTNIAAESFDVGWEPIPGLSSAQYTSSRAPGTNVDVISSTDRTRSFIRLTGGTSYEIEVQVIIPEVDSKSVTYFKFSQVTVPDALKGLSCVPVDANCFNVAWNGIDPVQSYTATVSPDTSNVVVNDALPGATVCGAVTGNLYQASVLATNSAGSGDAESVSGCRTALSSPTGITITVNSQTCFTVGWDAIASATAYRATLSSTGAADLQENATSSDVSVQICGLQPGTEYSATVVATYEAGDSNSSTEIVTQISAPEVPVLVFDSATTTSVTLSWSIVSSATTYHIVATGPAGPTPTESTSDLTVTISGLQPGTVYTFVGQSENNGGNSTDSAALEQITVPDVVQNLAADTQDVQLDVVFTWDLVIGAAQYNTSVTKDGSEVSGDTVTVNSWSGVTGLEDGETYVINVRAITAARSESQQSEPATFEFQTAPPTPANVVTSSVDTTSFEISWDASKSATEYEVKVFERQLNGSDGTEVTSHNPTSENQLIQGLVPGTVYKIKIRARNVGGWSLQHDDVLQITKPLAVTNLVVMRPVAQTEFTVNWDIVTGADSYEVSVNGGTPQTVADVTASFTSQSPGVEYTASVVAKTSGTDFGEQQTSEATEVTFKTAPSDPGTPASTTQTTTSITLEWTKSNGADIYTVVAIDAESNPVSTSTATAATTTTTESHEVTGLLSGSCYTMQIEASNGFGSSETVSGSDICTQTDPPNVSVTTVTDTTITIAWDAVRGALGYLTELRKISTGESVGLDSSFLRDSPAELPGTTAGLEPGTEYEITMRTVGDDSVDSEKTSISKFTLPALVSNLDCTPASETCFSVSWDTVLSATNYTADVTEGTGHSVDVNDTLPGAEVCDVTTGTLYNISVFATNVAGNGDAGPVTGCHSVLSVPTGVTIRVDSQTCFTIQWDVIVEATSYTLKLESDTAVTKQATATLNSGQICDLEPAILYRASVSATYAAGDSEFSSDDVSRITAPVAPSLTFATATTDSITLSWVASDTATDYFVETSQVEPPPTEPAAPQNTSDTTLLITDLTPGYVYSFVAYAENAGGRSVVSTTFEQITVPDAVQDLVANTEDVQKNVDFIWTASVGATAYSIAVTQGGTDIQQDSVSVASWNGINSDNINDGESYSITVVAVTEERTVAQSSAPAEIEFFTAPPTPTSVGIGRITTEEFEVSWGESTSATLYEIKVAERNPDGSDGETRTENSTTLSKVITGLSAGTVYKIRVKARNDGGWSLESSEVVQITVPNAVPDLEVTRPVPQTSFRLIWSGVTGAASYDISVTGGTSTLTDSVGGPTAEFTSQAPGTEYIVTVVAKTSTTEFGTQQSSEATELIFKTAPENASAPTPTEKTASSLTFTWTASDGADNYIAKALDSSGATIREETVIGTSATLDGLISGTCYTIQITAVNSFGSSANISGEICTIPSPPDFTISSVTTNTISLDWVEQPGAVGYVLEAKRSDGSLVTLSMTMPIRGTGANITGLDAGINYELSLHTVGIRDNSDKTIKTQITVCPAPEVTLVKRTTDTLGYTWNDVTGAVSYLVIYSTGSESNEAPVTDASYDITGLVAATVYAVTIRSINSAGSSETDLTHSTVISTGPTVTFSGVTATGFQISYTEVQDRDNFAIQINPGGISVTAFTLSEAIPSLSPGTTYSVVVVVNYQTVGQSAGSAPVNITTTTEAATKFALATNTQNEGITLSWDLATGATSYRVTAVRSDGNSTAYLFDNSPGLIPTVLGLTYNFTLETINSDGVTGGDSTPLENVQAEPVKVFPLELTMNSSYSFTDSLRDQTSVAFINLRDDVVNILTLIFFNVNGFVRITIVEFLQGSVVVRFNVDINDPNTDEVAVQSAYAGSTEDKTAFSADLTTNLNECLNMPSVCHADADCTDNDDSYTCACKTGYTGDGTTSCIDNNECNTDPCDDNADCTNTAGSYSCACKIGYNGNGVTCTDDDECATSGTCGGSSECKNTAGSYRCDCASGFTYSGTDCVDNDECATSAPCTIANSSCNNNQGSFSCDCDVGYTGDGSVNCMDVDECTQTPSVCTTNQTCANSDGSYTCSCKSGYEENTDASDCLDTDECSASTSPCLESATCSNSPGTYTCTCNTGFTGDGVTSCGDLNECDDVSTCGANETCTNSIGSYMCSCADGFSGTPDTQCLDIDECSDVNLCEPHGECDNTVGSYFCVCDTGYIGDGGNCTDKDECDANEIACSDRATCANTDGSYRCDCNEGYTGANDICTDVDECAGSPGPCSGNFLCTNVMGSYDCTCGDGYTLNGGVCENINECDLGTENCPADRACRDTDGNYACNCTTGYTGTICFGGQGCETCVNIDECADDENMPCHVNADCADTPGSFTCTCATYYVGDGITCTGNITTLYVVQTVSIYDFTAELSRATVTKVDLTAQVKTQIELQFTGFTFVSVTFTNASGVIQATYVMQTAMPLPTPVQLSDYYNSVIGDTTLFSSEPSLAESCSIQDCPEGYCYEYNSDEICECNVGYTLNNSQCVDVDECTGNLCSPQADCTNTDGSYTCACKAGYTGDGTSCTDVDECLSESFECIANSECNNTVGSYTCVCNSGYTKTTDNVCRSQCEDFSCENGGTCVPSATSDTPTCQCTSDFQGTRCQDSSLYRNLAIGFGVVGGVLLIALIITIVVYCVKRKRGGKDFVP